MTLLSEKSKMNEGDEFLIGKPQDVTRHVVDTPQQQKADEESPKKQPDDASDESDDDIKWFDLHVSRVRWNDPLYHFGSGER